MLQPEKSEPCFSCSLFDSCQSRRVFKKSLQGQNNAPLSAIRCFPDLVSLHAGVCWVLYEKASKSAVFFPRLILNETSSQPTQLGSILTMAIALYQHDCSEVAVFCQLWGSEDEIKENESIFPCPSGKKHFERKGQKT